MAAPKTVVAAMATGLAIRLAVIPFLFREWLDPFVVEHWAFGRVARSLVQGHGFGSPFADTGASALLPPVYASVLAVIFRIFGPNTAASVIAAAILNSLISVATCVPVYYIARRCFGERVARWCVWGWALSPYGIYFSADWLWSTCLFTLLLTILFLYSLKLEESPAAGLWIGFGVLSGIAALTEPVALSTAPLLAGWSCYRLRGRRKPWLAPGLCAAAALCLTLAPWIARNYVIFHQFIPVRDGYGLELYLGNSGYTEHWANRAVHPNHSDAELAEYERSGEIAYMAHKRDQAVAFIRANPFWFLRMSMRRAIYLWTGYWSFDAKYLEQEPLDPPNVFMGTSLSLLALYGLRAAFRGKNEHAVRFAIPLLAFPLVYYISHPEAYYLRPLDPLISILATFTIAGFAERRAALRLRRREDA